MNAGGYQIDALGGLVLVALVLCLVWSVLWVVALVAVVRIAGQVRRIADALEQRTPLNANVQGRGIPTSADRGV